MNVRRETPSIFELCRRHNKRKDQQVASNLADSLESKRGPAFRRLCSGQSCSAEAHESNVSPAEMRKKCFPYVANRNELRFSSVETRSMLVFYDSYNSDTESSWEEDGDDTLAGPFQAQNGYLRANNPQATRLYSDMKSQPQRDEREMFRKMRDRGLENSFLPRVVGEQSQGYFQNQANYTQGYSNSQANRQSCTCSLYHHDPFGHAANSLEYPLRLRGKTSRGYSRHCQDPQENMERRQTCSRTSSLYVHMQRNEANSPQGSQNELKKRETKLPPIQPLNDRARSTETLQRRQERQEVCEAKTQRRERREGVCPVTDSAREQRIFVRVLSKRF